MSLPTCGPNSSKNVVQAMYLKFSPWYASSHTTGKNRFVVKKKIKLTQVLNKGTAD